MRVGQAAVPGPSSRSQPTERALEEAAASLEIWARRRGWRAPENDRSQEMPDPEGGQHREPEGEPRR